MKKALSILLLVMLTAPLLLTEVWMKVEQRSIRRAVKWKIAHHLDAEELVVLSFHKDEVAHQLRWEHDKEFEFLGRMYDVVRTHQSHDSISYECWPDDDETQLNLNLQTTVSKLLNASPEKQDREAQVMQFIRNLYFNSINTIAFIPRAADIYFVVVHQQWDSQQPSPPSPPPQWIG